MRSLKQRFYKQLAIASFLFVVFPASVLAEPMISLDPTSATTGLVSGDFVSLDVNIDFTDVVGTLGGGLDISWDIAELGLISVTPNGSFGNQDLLTGTTFVSGPTATAGMLSDWSFVEFDIFTGFQGGILGSIVFEVLAITALDALVEVTATTGLGGPWTSFSTGLAFDPQPTYTGATVSIVSVPTPTTLSLLAFGVVGLVGFRRRVQ